MGSSPVQLDFSKAQPIAAASPQTSPVTLDFSQAQPLSSSNPNPYPIADDEKGALNQTLKTGEGLLKLPGHIWDAFTRPFDPNDADEADAQKNGGAGAVAVHRIIVKPMKEQLAIADAYQKIADAKKAGQRKTTPEDTSVKGRLKTLFFGNDDKEIAHAVDAAQAHRLAAIVPLLGPLAGDITEHWSQGDESGAVASLLSNIATGKVIDSATKGIGKQISKVAPKTVTVAGESTPVMAGQLKDAAPIAEEVAKTPSTEIAAKQQTAAQQGIKNIATDAANKTLNKLGKTTDEAESFGDASKQIKEAAQPTFKKLDELSEGMFSTFQNKLASANKMIRKATSMEDLEKAEAQAGEAQKGIDDLFKHHADEIGADDLAKAKSAYRDQSVLAKVHSYVESAFSAPEDVANGSDSVTRTIKGNALRPRLNQMLKKIPAGDLERTIGKDGVQSLYEIAKLTEKPEGMADMQNLIGQIAGHGYITRIVKSPIEARNLVARYLATSPRVAHTAISALKFGTPAKVYAPIIANAIAESEKQDSK